MSLEQPVLKALPDPKTFKIKSKSKKTLLKFAVKRDHQGVRIYCKSEIIEKYFKSQVLQGSIWQGYSSYTLRSGIGNMYYDALTSWGTNHIIKNDIPNLSILRTVGLSDGVTLTLPIVSSRAEVKQYVKLAKLYIMGMYKEHIKNMKVNDEARINTIGYDKEYVNYLLDIHLINNTETESQFNTYLRSIEDGYFERVYGVNTN